MQVESGLMKRIIRYKENTSLLEECTAELNHAMDVFKVNGAHASHDSTQPL